MLNTILALLRFAPRAAIRMAAELGAKDAAEVGLRQGALHFLVSPTWWRLTMASIYRLIPSMKKVIVWNAVAYVTAVKLHGVASIARFLASDRNVDNYRDFNRTILQTFENEFRRTHPEAYTATLLSQQDVESWSMLDRVGSGASSLDAKWIPIYVQTLADEYGGPDDTTTPRALKALLPNMDYADIVSLLIAIRKVQHKEIADLSQPSPTGDQKEPPTLEALMANVSNDVGTPLKEEAALAHPARLPVAPVERITGLHPELGLRTDIMEVIQPRSTGDIRD